MQNIALMMTYNEEDIIAEVMQSNKKYFDKILVLDGSTDKTEDIIRSFDNVSYFLKDQNLFPKRKIRDGVRQFLLEKAQEMYGFSGWFTLLHGDEIFVDNPNEIAQRAEKAKAEKVNWHSLNFFLHTSQIKTYNPKNRIQDEVVFYQPGGLEIRQFKNKPDIFYNLNQMRNVLPYGIGGKILFDFPILKHYVLRSVQQKINKPIGGLQVSRDETIPEFFGQQIPAKITNKNKAYTYEDCFVDKIDPSKKQVRKYTGSFDEFEPSKRPPFFFQWLNWHKYT